MVPITKEKPAAGWTYSDQAKTFRPRNAYYCGMCKVVIQEYDHTCPWTGTGIGKNNLTQFKVFASSICLLFWYEVGLIGFAAYQANK